jgi:hypothetical protein
MNLFSGITLPNGYKYTSEGYNEAKNAVKVTPMKSLRFQVKSQPFYMHH